MASKGIGAALKMLMNYGRESTVAHGVRSFAKAYTQDSVALIGQDEQIARKLNYCKCGAIIRKTSTVCAVCK